MNEREQIQQAITALSAQRILLGNSAVKTTVAVLRERLEMLDDNAKAHLPRSTQRKQITILFANVTGLSSVTQAIPDTNMLDIMNLLWQRLDKAITNQGGTIDKHIGDAVMGLFGVPVAREDDPERAIRAALAMRAALSDFVTEFNAQAKDTLSWGPETDVETPTLQLRVGINTGPVMLGGIGMDHEYTVIGDAVNVASRLERAAPAGGILISHDTHLLTRDVFDTEPLGPVTIRGKSQPMQVYLALRAKPRRSFLAGRGVEGVETQMVGRDKEMALLKQTLETAVTTHSGHIITISGDAGVGKSRLIQEYNEWVLAQSPALPTFKGQADQRMSQQSYSLVRNILAAYFNIQDSDPSRLAQEKLVQGIHHSTGISVDDAHARARIIGQLVGLNLASSEPHSVTPTESPQIRNRVYGYLIDLFKHIIAAAPVTLFFLEDMHWADKASLDFLDHLVQICHTTPLVVINLTRPSLFEYKTEWGKPKKGNIVPQTTLQLHPLTEEQSYQLVTDILQKLPEIPTDLCNLVVEKAEGNPFYVEEIIKVFIEDGLILAKQDAWQLQSTHFTDIRVPSTLTGVLQSRLDRLSQLELATLQRAAVVGRMFWDSAVIHMNELAADPLQANETIAALKALEKREMIFKRHTSVFTGIQTYYFKHAILHEVTYEGVLLRDRPVFHKQVGDWLADQSGERIAEYASLIAGHYELAGQHAYAAELYEMAAVRAQDMSNPAEAIKQYGEALALLTERTHDVTWQVRLQRRLGKLLQMQARFVEAAQTYMTMRYTAEIDGDLASQAHAWNGLAQIQYRQADFSGMLESAMKAEEVAWLVSAETELAQALLLKSKAHLYFGDSELAAAAANRAVTISESEHDTQGVIQSLSLLSRIYIKSGREGRAQHYLEELIDQLDLQDLPPAIIALNRANQGLLFRQLEQYDKAVHELIGALDIYRELDHQSEMAFALNQLGELGRLRGNPTAAIPLFREALSIAEAVGDVAASMFYRANLGGALVSTEDVQMGISELLTLVKLAKSVSFVVNWMGLPKAHRFLACGYLNQNDPISALTAVKQTLSSLPGTETKGLGAAWRVLGTVAAQMPKDALPIMVNDQPYEAKDCFAKSLTILREHSGSVTKREQALTLLAWSKYALQQGHVEQSETLANEGQTLAKSLGIEV